MALKMTDKLDNLRTFDTAFLDLKVKAVQAQATDDGKALPVEALVQKGCLPAQGPGSGAGWPGAQSALINEEDEAFLAAGLFFKAGQVLRFQIRICLSSRSMARRSGL